MYHQKIYTVSLPPDDYVPGPQNNNGSSTTENSDIHEDIEGTSFFVWDFIDAGWH